MRVKQLVNILLAVVVSVGAGWMARQINMPADSRTCSEAALEAVLDGGDLILRDCELQITETKVVTGDVTITGGMLQSQDITLLQIAEGGNLTLADTALKTNHVPLVILPDATAVLHNVVFFGGNKPLVNHGRLTAVDTLFQNFTCQAPCYGAAMLNIGHATVMRGFFRSNTITAPDNWREQRLSVTGGAIHNRGQLIVAHSRFNDNTAPFGGAIDNQGHLLIQDSTMTGNRTTVDQTGGGAILNRGRAIVQRVRFEENQAGIAGGAILNRSGLLTVHDSIFDDNACLTQQCAGSAVFNFHGQTDARFNYWGRESGPNRTETNLVPEAYTPYLETVPSWVR